MVDFKQVNASDNPDHEKTEEQRERDRAQKRKESGDAAAAAGTDDNRDAVEREARQGRGPAGLNQGPSDTRSADPHRPIDGRPVGAGGSYTDPRTSDGMGSSPPRGAQPRSDKPEHNRPIQDRAQTNPSPDAQRLAEEERRESDAADKRSRDQRGY